MAHICAYIEGTNKGDRDMSGTYATATNEMGQMIDFEAAANLMDDDIREDLHSQGIDDPTEFLRAYAERHEEAFGEPFAPWSGGAW